MSKPRQRRRRTDLYETDKEIKSPLLGHEFRFFEHRFHVLQSARQTDDGSLRLDYSAPARANIPEHVHPTQEESFEVVSGTLGIRVGGRESMLGPGQSAVGPPNLPHAWWNPSDEDEVRFVAGIRPGLDVEILFETILGLMRDGKTIGSIPRNPLQLAILACQIGNWAYPTGPSVPVWRMSFAPVAALAFVGRTLGYRTQYPAYSSPEHSR